MEDIYPILAKHFLGQATTEEEQLITAFKQENSKEYSLLKAVWNEQDISIQEFDTQKAWAAFIAKREKKRTKVIPLFGNIRNIAAAILLLLVGIATTMYLPELLSKSNTILVENTNENILEQQLSDGSTIWLNRGASITYPEEFDSATRAVTLKGEAFFEVAEDKAHPFVVTADYSTITVLGTSFNINTTNQRTMVSVRTGKVEVVSKSGNEKAILSQNQSAVVNENDFLTSNTIDSNYLSWKTGIFEFVDTPITQVVARLNSFYQDSLSIDTSKTYNCNLSAKFDRAPLNEVLKILEVTCGVSVEKSGNLYTIK